MTEPIDKQTIETLWTLLYRPGDVTEMRILNAKRAGTVSGYFDNPAALLRAATRWQGEVSVYMTLNPVLPALLSRCANRTQEYAKQTTADKDIPRRLWLLLDFDAVRPSGIGATDTEHENALRCMAECSRWLRENYQIAGIEADSGNGGHILLPVDLPNDEASRALCKRFLEALALRFDDAAVKVDQETFNAARITKLYGTLAIKGDNTTDRPHRPTYLLVIPETIVPASLETLTKIAASAPVAEPSPSKGKSSSGGFDVRHFLAEHGIRVQKELPHESGTKLQLEKCPFDPEHRSPDSAVFLLADGRLGFRCLHKSCHGKSWSDFREHLEPGYRQERERREREWQEKKQTKPSPSAAEPAPEVDEEEELLETICLADVPAERVKWLWQNRIPFGKLTVIDGDPDKGKTTVMLDIAARLTRGDFMPYEVERPEASCVLLMSAEDGLGDTLRPRLQSAEAKLENIYFLDEVPAWTGSGDKKRRVMQPPSIPEDIPRITALVKAKQVKLVLIDPLMAYLSGKVSSNTDQDVRRALAPIKKMAEETGAAVVVIRHLNKMTSVGSAMYRGGGSIGITGAARSALLVGQHPDNEDQRVIARVKCNLSRHALSLAYSLESNEELGVARVVWHGVVPYKADELISPPQKGEKAEGKIEEAREFYRTHLAGVKDFPSAEMDALLQQKGIATRTAKRARAELGIRSRQRKVEGKPKWFLSLPKEDTSEGVQEAEGHTEYTEETLAPWPSDTLSVLKVGTTIVREVDLLAGEKKRRHKAKQQASVPEGQRATKTQSASNDSDDEEELRI